jgi:hypothetical protein
MPAITTRIARTARWDSPPPLGPAQAPVAVAGGRVVRSDRLGGLIGEYSQAA